MVLTERLSDLRLVRALSWKDKEMPDAQRADKSASARVWALAEHRGHRASGMRKEERSLGGYARVWATCSLG